MKVLFVATISSFVNAFLVNNIKILHELGYEIHIAVGKDGDMTVSIPKYVKIHYLEINRSPYRIKENFHAYKQLLMLLKKEQINLIDCHTPVGGVLGRLIAKKMKIKCIYTAHGFHFYKGAPLINWLLYYPIEKWLSRYTDVLITINNEDYNRAKEKLKMRHLEYIPGVGVDVERFQLANFECQKYREQLGFTENDFVILSVGELANRKNHIVIIKAIESLNDDNVKYIIVGEGSKKEELINYIHTHHLSNQVQLLGFRKDIPELCQMSDIFAFPSLREGLGLAGIEAMAAGLPIITSNINGINDYSIDGVTGYTCDYDDVDGFSKCIKKLINDPEKRKLMGKQNINRAKKFDKQNVHQIMKKIYVKLTLN